MTSALRSSGLQTSELQTSCAYVLWQHCLAQTNIYIKHNIGGGSGIAAINRCIVWPESASRSTLTCWKPPKLLVCSSPLRHCSNNCSYNGNIIAMPCPSLRMLPRRTSGMSGGLYPFGRQPRCSFQYLQQRGDILGDLQQLPIQV